MKIEDVALFERIAALGSVSAAGRDLGLSATVASERLARLERDLGCTLAHRSTRALSLTEDGERFLDHAHGLLGQFEAARASVGPRASRPAGIVRFTAPAYFGRLFLLSIVRDFLAEHPDVTLKLSLSDTVADYVAEGMDLAVRIGEMPDSSLRTRKLADNHRVLCAAPAYIDRKGQPNTPHDLVHHECLVLGTDTRWRIDMNGRSHVVAVHPRVMTDSAEVIKAAVLAGLGIAERSLWDVADDLATNRLVQVLPGCKIGQDMAIWLVFPPGRYRSLATRRLAEVIGYGLKDVLSHASQTSAG